MIWKFEGVLIYEIVGCKIEIYVYSWYGLVSCMLWLFIFGELNIWKNVLIILGICKVILISDVDLI